MVRRHQQFSLLANIIERRTLRIRDDRGVPKLGFGITRHPKLDELYQLTVDSCRVRPLTRITSVAYSSKRSKGAPVPAPLVDI
jgi:hypothetical protein